MNYEIEKSTNNSKKLIIGISILFCTVILIIGATTAFFTQSGSETTGNIVTADINGTIGYSDNNDYMRGNLIPVKETDISLFAMKNSLHSSGKYTNDDICKYQDDMYACSLYQFTITNNVDVTLELMVTLNPYPNEFANLHYMVYEGEQDKLTTASKEVKTATHINGNNSSRMINGLILEPKESKTYTVVFYIKSQNYDQTSEDAGKNFGAIIRVDSITTGTYLSISVGETCYVIQDLNDGTFKLFEFKGINDDGSVVEGCGVTRDDATGYYSVTIPSSVGDNKISTIGEDLFYSNKDNISSVIIPSGITTIEDYGFDDMSNLTTVTFEGALDGRSQLQTIGGSAFRDTSIESITIPAKVTTIGDSAFNGNSNLTSVTFAGAEDGTSQLTTIGDWAFHFADITTLTIPKNVTTIGESAFSGNSNLKEVIFKETTDENIKMIIGDSAFADASIESLTIPVKVTSIGIAAFVNNSKLTSLTFSGALDGRSQLTTIGDSAFYSCNLTYETNTNPLILPSSVTTMGSSAFRYNNNLKFIYYPEDDSVFPSNWKGNATILKELVNNNQ